MKRKPTPPEVEAEVAALGDLNLAAIRERWRALFGNPPPLSLRHAFLVAACAYSIRTKAFGGLSAATRRRLRAIAEAARDGKPTPAAPVRTKAGTRLVRAWGGHTHVVTTQPDGRFEYDGQTYRSLSAIARAITGTNWNGHTFFGVKRTTTKDVGKTPASTRDVSAAHAATRGGPGVARWTVPSSGGVPDAAPDDHADTGGGEPETATTPSTVLNADDQLEMFANV